MNISLYFHTLRYLKPIQVFGRISRRFKSLDCCAPNGLEIREVLGNWTCFPLNTQSLFEDGSACFLNQSGRVESWNDPSKEKLWLYNLHYFDDLNSAGAVDRVEFHNAFIDRWINENPAPKGNGWEPYTLSLRIVNWVRWFLSIQKPSEHQVASLALQAKVLHQSLETHLLGNHLFANAKALLFAGLYLKGPDADLWRHTAIKILEKQIPEQILDDGGNFELTPMYHAIMTADMLDLVNLLQTYRYPELTDVEPSWRKRVASMISWLQVMSHPDGFVSLFNDSATDIAPTLDQLAGYASALNVDVKQREAPPIRHLQQSGYIRIEQDEGVAILDVGRVGPDYIPGHAHADSLSFESSVFGCRLVVNSGTSCYGSSAERVRQRGTAAHSTVIIDNQDSSQVWGGFRVAQRAYPLDLDCSGSSVRCSHNGYRRLPGKPVHHRVWQYGNRNLVVEDQLDGSFESAQARFHFHPDWQLTLEDDRVICRNSQRIVEVDVLDGIPRLESGTYHPEFGKSYSNTILVLEITDRSSKLNIRW